MFYTVYQITNKVNGKIYIGMHKTSSLEDDYMGSGKHLRRAIEKYGVENFTKDILHVFDNEQDMRSKEAELVNEEFLSRKDVYNLCPGGKGGFGYLNNSSEILSRRGKSSAKSFWTKFDDDETFRTDISSKRSEVMNNGLSVKMRKSLNEKYPNGTFKGKTHTEELKRQISERMKINQKGENNSQFGTTWITDGFTNKKIKKDSPIPDGWYRGMIVKKNNKLKISALHFISPQYTTDIK